MEYSIIQRTWELYISYAYSVDSSSLQRSINNAKSISEYK